MVWVERLKEYGKRIFFWQVPRYERVGMYVQAIIVVLCYACWSIFPLAPGDTIAGLAAVAVIMTVRAGYFTKVEQVVWVTIGFALFGGEIAVIHRDRDQHDSQQRMEEQKQATQFSDTLKSFQDLHEQNQAQLEGMTILRRTREAEGLAKDTLENITGGDSYICFQPQTVMGPIPTTVQGRSDRVMLMLVYVSPDFIGKHPLHNVLVEVSDTITGIRDYDYGTMLPFSRVIKAPPINLDPDKSKQFAAAFVTTSNGNYTQPFLFLKINEKWTWSTRCYKGVGNTRKLIREWSAPDFPKDYHDPDWEKQ